MKNIVPKEAGNIGKLLIMEFEDNESAVFDDIMSILQKYPDFQKYRLKDECILSLPTNLKIRPDRRIVYSGSLKIRLTKKEFDILRLLIVNRGQVITYEQIYQNVWNECVADRENTVISYHIRNLRKKLAAIPNICIRCVREMGYCVEIKAEDM